MRSRRAAYPARLARFAILLLTSLSLLGTGGAASTAGAAPSAQLVADTPARVVIQITTLTPLSPGPKDTLRVSGRVVSYGPGTLSHVQVSLHLGASVASRTGLAGLRANPVPQLLASPIQDLGDGQLPAGHSLAFTISTPMSALPISSDGVYPMQVLATGRDPGAAGSRDLTTVSTFLPYITQEEATPATPLAWLVPLTSNPSLLADGTFANDSVITSVESGGRLRRLLDGVGAAKAVTATIDPATIRELALASNGGYAVTGTPTSKQATKSAGTAAKSWLADLRAADQLGLIGLPYADPDVEALVHAGQSSLADAARRRAGDVLSAGLSKATSRLIPDIAVAPGGRVDQAGASYFSKQDQAEGLVLTADAVPASGDNPSAVARTPGVPTRLLLSDAVLTELVTAAPPGGDRLAEQDILAELAESHLEDRVANGSPSGSRTGAARPLLIAPASGWSPSASWLRRLLSDTARVPWLKQVSVSNLLSVAPEPRAALQYPPAAIAAELPANLVDTSAQITAATSGLFRVAERGDEPQPRSPQSIVQPIKDAALVAVSSRWRGSPQSASLFNDSAQQTLQNLQQQVKVVASPQVTLTSRSGRVPVTLENDLPAAVDVSLELTSLDESRVSSGAVVRRTVPAGQKVQVEVEVKAASAGTFPVRLALFTPNGQLLGTPAQVLVRSTTYGVVATVFTAVALSVLGLAVLFRAVRSLIRRSRRRRSEPEPA